MGSPERLTSGTLILVVGPSGAGKDSLLEGARTRLADRSDILFPRREITRPADAGGEDHIAVSEDTFAERDASGAYLLSWRAHGLGYGVPASLADDLSASRSVVVNVSRGVLDDARARVERCAVISLRVPSDVLAARLRGRGRESDEQIAERVARAEAFSVSGDDVIEISNDGPLDRAIDRIVSAIRAAISRAAISRAD